MLTRDGAGRILRARWPPLVALTATLAYAVVVIGFGLDFRPLHNDEGVTLGVASRASALDVLRVAVDHRHGPPLHYLLVHAALAWRHDILGLRLPSAVLGIVAVAISYGFGRELIGRAGGAVVAVVTASSPIMIHLGQFARGYTAMIAAAYAQRLAHARAAAHRPRPLGGAVRRRGAPARVGPPVRAVRASVRARALGPVRRRRAAARARRPAPAGGGRGRRDPAGRPGARAAAPPVRASAEQVRRRLRRRRWSSSASTRFWERLGDAASGSAHVGFGIALGVAALLGLAALRGRNRPRRCSRRCGSCCRSCCSRCSPRPRATSRPSGTCRSCCRDTRSRSRGSRSSCAASRGARFGGLDRGRGGGRAARPRLGGRPQRARELQRQPARRQPVHGRPLRPPRTCWRRRPAALAGGGPAPRRRLRGAGGARLLAAQHAGSTPARCAGAGWPAGSTSAARWARCG